jgi:hypothetical protein
MRWRCTGCSGIAAVTIKLVQKIGQTTVNLFSRVEKLMSPVVRAIALSSIPKSIFDSAINCTFPGPNEML